MTGLKLEPELCFSLVELTSFSDQLGMTTLLVLSYKGQTTSPMIAWGGLLQEWFPNVWISRSPVAFKLSMGLWPIA